MLARRQGMHAPCAARRHCPETILAHLTTALEPPTDAAVRADFVRLAMSTFASARGHYRLGSVFYSAPIDALKGLFLALQGSPAGDDEDTCPVTYRRALKTVAPAWRDAEFVRLASIAGDVLDWSADGDEWERYVRPAWLVLCDEVEFERDAMLLEWEDCHARRHDISLGCWWEYSAYTEDEAKQLSRADLRRWGR